MKIEDAVIIGLKRGVVGVGGVRNGAGWSRLFAEAFNCGHFMIDISKFGRV